MAGFRMHVSTSTVLGCGYAGVLSMYGVPMPTATVAGAMCGFSGMLPDLDSDYGVPLREAMAFSAATLPMLLVGHFQSLALSRDTMVLAAVGLYLAVRFGITNMIRKYTVHRGMFHSFPAMFIFGGIAFLVSSTSPFDVRCYKAGGVMGGFLSHLVLDEIYAIEFKGGRWRFKKSFGTAMKFWGDDAWSNFSTYAKLAIVGMLILGEPSVMKQLETNQPQFASQLNDLRNRFEAFGSKIAPQNGSNGPTVAAAPPNAPPPNNAPYSPAPSGSRAYSASPPQSQPAFAPINNQRPDWQWPVANQSYNSEGQPANFQTDVNTAQRQFGTSAQ
jgi:LexA-binding, inner membrane-associated putative hydrolase